MELSEYVATIRMRRGSSHARIPLGWENLATALCVSSCATYFGNYPTFSVIFCYPKCVGSHIHSHPEVLNVHCVRVLWVFVVKHVCREAVIYEHVITRSYEVLFDNLLFIQDFGWHNDTCCSSRTLKSDMVFTKLSNYSFIPVWYSFQLPA